MTDVYRCLPRKMWSVRESGRVVGHVNATALMDVRFHCSGSGVRRIQANRRREVVAYARGRLIEAPLLPSAVRICFCPFTRAGFVTEDGWPVVTAHLVHFMPNGQCWGILS